MGATSVRLDDEGGARQQRVGVAALAFEVEAQAGRREERVEEGAGAQDLELAGGLKHGRANALAGWPHTTQVARAQYADGAWIDGALVGPKREIDTKQTARLNVRVAM